MAQTLCTVCQEKTGRGCASEDAYSAVVRSFFFIPIQSHLVCQTVQADGSGARRCSLRAASELEGLGVSINFVMLAFRCGLFEETRLLVVARKSCLVAK